MLKTEERSNHQSNPAMISCELIYIYIYIYIHIHTGCFCVNWTQAGVITVSFEKMPP
jgi:hypothetical protein